MNCTCLCAVNHLADVGICTGEHDTEIVFHSPRTGLVEVAMCSACAAATLAAAQREREQAR